MNPFDFIVATLLAQGLASLLLAGILWMFQRSREHRFVKLLAVAFIALSIHLACFAIALMLGQHELTGPLPAHLAMGVALSAFFPFLSLLVLGMHSGVAVRPLSVRVERWLIGLSVATGAGLGMAHGLLGFSAVAADIVRIPLPYAVAAAVFLVLSWHMNRTRLSSSALISPILGTTAFALMGLFLLYVSTSSLFMALNQRLLFHSPFVALLGLLFLGLIGLSMVVWLLENEQQKAREARLQALSAEKRLLYFRTHDAATGLPNQRQSQNLLSQELLQTAEHGRRRVAVLALGIHRFKDVSAAVGWHRTEDMMSDLSRRIREKLPEHFILGRTGERDFVVVMPNVRRPESAADHARKIIARIRLPFQIKGQTVFLNVSGGMSIGPDHSDDAVTLIHQAQRAQLQAASSGVELVVHEPSAQTSQLGGLVAREADMRRACEEGQFILFYQPLVSIHKRRIAGFEALLRWQHPTKGILGPDHFLQDAASLGVLEQIEEQIFTQALAQLASWHSDLALAPVSVSINVSPDRFQQPGLAEKMASMCHAHGVSPGYLDLELTENAAIKDFEAGLDTIRRLRDQGIKVSLDDFGTGYSSLSHLQRLQVDYVKLDRSFVQGIEHDPQQLALTRAIVELIHSLDMQVLAEGVETRAQLGHLIRCRVDFVQGYLLGRPRPAGEYHWLLEQKYISEF